MRSIALLPALLAAVVLVDHNPTKAQQPTVTHLLRIAASPQAVFTDEDADDIIQRMNADLQKIIYPGDVQCAGIAFKRQGHVFTSDKLNDAGSYEDLVKNLKQFAPSANLFVVSSVNCASIVAAGCGPVGGEPAVVGDQWPRYSDEIWLHERGHNMKLLHSAEGPKDEDQQPADIGKRFMFWHIGDDHFGKTKEECDAFRVKLYASIVSGAPAAVAGLNLLPAGVIAPVLAATPPTSTSGQSATGQPQSDVATGTGLTPAAFKVVGFPWLEKRPDDAIRALSSDDIESIRSFLKKRQSSVADEQTPIASQAYQVLALVGTAADAALIAAPLSSPLPAAPPGKPDAGMRQQLRWAFANKNASVAALGVLADRTKSQEAIQALESHLDLSAASKAVGPATAGEFSKSILATLSKSDVATAKATVQEAIKASKSLTGLTTVNGQSTTQSKVSTGSTVAIPRLSAPEISRLQANLSSSHM